ncbi:putative aspartate/other aminotransferase, aminotransferase, class I/classII [Helianthus anomalus]
MLFITGGSEAERGPLRHVRVIKDRNSGGFAFIDFPTTGMADRIIGMRTSLRENIEKLGSPLSREHITNHIGMFFYSGMTPEHVDCLTKEFHIYIVVAGHAYCSNCCSWPCLLFC